MADPLKLSNLELFPRTPTRAWISGRLWHRCDHMALSPQERNTTMALSRRTRAFLVVTASLATAMLAATPARATVVTDALGDFLPIYSGPRSGDLDVAAVEAFRPTPNQVVLLGTHAAPVGTTPGTAYVWGIDRGAGTQALTTLNPPTGQGVSFDSVVVLAPDRTGFFLDLVLGGAPQILDPSTIDISGPTLTVSLPASLMPSQGLAFADYRYNLWPRFAPNGVNPADNTQISDFAPNASTFAASARVPEPASLTLLTGGLLAFAAANRRRGRS